MLLSVAVTVDAGTVLGAGVMALSHALGRIVALPKHLQQLLIPHRSWLEHDQDGFSVTSHAGAHLAIGGVGR